MAQQVVHHIMIGGHSGDSGSLLEKLNEGERRTLHDWASNQRSANGVVDLMRWPGWNDAARRMQADTNAALAQARDVIHRVMSRGDE
jgi:hypothetical protein